MTSGAPLTDVTLTRYWLPSFAAVCPVSARFVLVAPDTLENLPVLLVRFCHWNEAVPELVTLTTTAKVAAPLDVVLSVLFVPKLIVLATSAVITSSKSPTEALAAADRAAIFSALCLVLPDTSVYERYVHHPPPFNPRDLFESSAASVASKNSNLVSLATLSPPLIINSATAFGGVLLKTFAAARVPFVVPAYALCNSIEVVLATVLTI